MYDYDVSPVLCRPSLPKTCLQVAMRTTMDFVNPPPPSRGSGSSDLMGLPTHLPNDSPEPTAQDEHPSAPAADAAEEEATPSSAVAGEPVFIPGTNITLQTEEDIRKWIEERKKNWPSRKNVALKEEAKNPPSVDIATNKREGPESAGPKKKQKAVCRFYQQHGRCKFGTKCKNSHEAPATGGGSTVNEHEATHYKRQINGIPVLIPKLYSKRQASGPNGALFRSLVQKELYENENSVVLDFIQYLDKQGLINHDVMKKSE